MFKGYEQPDVSTQPDTVVAVIPTFNLDEDYLRLKEAGVKFLGNLNTLNHGGCAVLISETRKVICLN